MVYGGGPTDCSTARLTGLSGSSGGTSGAPTTISESTGSTVDAVRLGSSARMPLTQASAQTDVVADDGAVEQVLDSDSEVGQAATSLKDLGQSSAGV